MEHPSPKFAFCFRQPDSPGKDLFAGWEFETSLPEVGPGDESKYGISCVFGNNTVLLCIKYMLMYFYMVAK